MFNSYDIDELGRKNEWPCVCDSIWEEPGFCPSYGLAGCPAAARENRPCTAETSGFAADMMPLIFLS